MQTKRSYVDSTLYTGRGKHVLNFFFSCFEFCNCLASSLDLISLIEEYLSEDTSHLLSPYKQNNRERKEKIITVLHKHLVM